MVTIQFDDEKVWEKKGISGRTQKPYVIREQTCIVHGISRFPVESRVNLPDGRDCYKIGHYEVTTPFVLGRFGFEVARDLGLVPVKAAAKAVA